MGYTTEFSGQLAITPPLPTVLVAYINNMANTRRMKRNLPPLYGIEGEFFVMGKGVMGQDNDPTVIDGNHPPFTQPGLWLQWIISDDGTRLEWDEGEKFYAYVEWLAYLYKEILLPLGHTLSGHIKWRGEDFDDMGNVDVDGPIIRATGYPDIDCTPDAYPRFMDFIRQASGEHARIVASTSAAPALPAVSQSTTDDYEEIAKLVAQLGADHPGVLAMKKLLGM